MSSLFILSGAPGTGKTTILREISQSGYKIVSEPARQILAEQRKIEGRGVPETDPGLFCKLILDRATATYIDHAGANELVFFDRGIPDVLAYLDHFKLDNGAALSAANEHRYNKHVFFTSPWRAIYTNDEERKMSFEDALVFSQLLAAHYTQLGYVLVDIPQGSPPERAAFVVNSTKDALTE